MKTNPVLIDTDPAISIFGADVDDALAIFLALNSDKLEVAGITTVFGNTDQNNAYRIAKELLSIAGRSKIPVLKGAYNASWLGIRTPAAQFLIDQIMEHPNEITLITLAPLTNVATAFILEPRVAENLKRMVMMGGLFFPSVSKIRLIQSEFNFSKDALATRHVLAQDIDTTVVGLDLTSQVLFTDAHYNILRQAQTPISNYLTKHLKSWLLINKLLLGRGFAPHDPIAMAYLLQKNLFKTIKTSIEVHVSQVKPKRLTTRYSNSLFSALSTMLSKNGQTKVKVPTSNNRKNKIKVCWKVKEQAFLKLLLTQLTQT
ncbi:MAG: nucleoside hydrolase [Candidatus Helarchaeota archaeon]